MSALTKMFIVLQLLFSVVCASLLIMFVSKTENYKNTVTDLRASNVGLGASLVNSERAKTVAEANVATLQGQYNEAMNQLTKAKADASTASAKLEADKQGLASQLAAVTAQVQTLTSANNTSLAVNAANQAELTKLRPQVVDLTKKYADINRAKDEVDNQLKAAEQAIRKLQLMIAQGGGTGAGAVAPIGSGGQIQMLTASNAASAGKVNGQISDVASALGRTLIEMPLGERDGIKVGTKMYVYRASGYVADATVERVSADQAVAVVISTKPGETVKVGDLISTVGQ